MTSAIIGETNSAFIFNPLFPAALSYASSMVVKPRNGTELFMIPLDHQVFRFDSADSIAPFSQNLKA
jgi:hypothetical protein